MILKARHVMPVCGPPIENGLVEIHESRIVAVRRVSKHDSASSVIDCGDSVVLPGFVNAHAHLELTHLAGRVPPDTATPECGSPRSPDFTNWLSRLLTAIGQAGEDQTTITASINRGAALSLAAGVTAVGDITRRPSLTRPVLRHERLRVVSFGEVIALGSIGHLLDERLAAAEDVSHDSDRLSAAISPHAPYSCDRRAIRACVAAAAKHKMRLCMHLAETADEEDCTLHGRGPLVEYARSLGVWTDDVKPVGLRPVDLAAELGVLSPRTLLAHVNYVSDDDLGTLARYSTHVAYCPRTHAAFGHAPHRFRDMLRAGINVCVGTDSLASNPSLSVLDELRFLRREFGDLESGLLMDMGTLRGAKALGLGNKIGSLEPGKEADLLVIPLDAKGPREPAENVLRSGHGPTQVYIAGRRVPGNNRQLAPPSRRVKLHLDDWSIRNDDRADS